MLSMQDQNVEKTSSWRGDFLVEYQGEGKAVPPLCPRLGYGVFVSIYSQFFFQVARICCKMSDEHTN